MMKRSFIGLAMPRFEYESVENTPAEPEKIPVPKTALLFFKKSYDPKNTALLKIGDRVKTGQKLLLYPDNDAYVISPVTGSIAAISPYTGDFGQSYTSVSINVAQEEETDEQFGTHAKSINLEIIKDYLACVPGNPPLDVFSNPDKKINIIVVCGTDSDLLITTNQHILKSNVYFIDRGISLLKKATGAENVVVAIPEHLTKIASTIGGSSGVEIKTVEKKYPAALPYSIARNLLGKTIPAGKTCEDMGICFFSAEAVASIGCAADKGQIPLTKTLTLVKKNLSKVLVEARIGTPIRDIFSACDVTVNDGDRIIIGGPMTGKAVYSEDYPVLPDTDAIMLQDGEDVAMVSDYPCINCGDCVRICPANVAVNMLVRFCEAGQYETAADEYDLYSCIECGLCSFVCVAKMPIFQYIRLAKYELSQIVEETGETEAANA